MIDSHCHLDIAGDESWPAVAATLAAAQAVGVAGIVQIGCDLPSAAWAVAAANEFAAIVAGVALHPNEPPRIVAEQGVSALEPAYAEIARLAADPRVRVIGETGLDFFRTGPEGRVVQEESFRWHIQLAKTLGKPLMIHDRSAHDDVLRVLADEGAPAQVVFHCFSGDVAMARTCVERGYVLSFAGTVTFKNAGGLRDALRVTPLDHLLVETDAPFLTPTPYRGQTNASYLVPLTVRAMAEVKEVDTEVLSAAIASTAARIFGPFWN